MNTDREQPAESTGAWAHLRLTKEEARALNASYALLKQGVAGFPADELKGVEPPLRALPGPTGAP